MPEPEAPPRRLLQLHLSTCIVLMIVAGSILGLNVIPQNHRTVYGIPVQCRLYGWPEIVSCKYDYSPYDGMDYVYVPDEGLVSIERVTLPDEFSLGNLHINLTVFLVSCATVIVICEWSIRRRKRRRAAPEGINAQKTES